MKNFARRLSNSLRTAVSWQLQGMRRRALKSELASTFQRLETRRVLSVEANFDPITGLLNVAIDNQPGGNTAVLRENSLNVSQFFLDENNNGLLGGNEAFGLKTALRQIEVSSTDGGTFLWLGNFANSPVDQILIQNVNDVRFNTQATIGLNNNLNSSVTALNSVEFENNLRFERDVSVNVTNVIGTISNDVDADLTVVGRADFEATNIELGSSNNDAIHFGTLHFRSTGNVEIHEDSGMTIVDIGVETNNANTLTLSALGNLEIATSADIDVQGQSIFVAIGNNSDIVVNGTTSTVNGSLTFQADDSIFFGSAASVIAGGNNSQLVGEANFDNANGDSNDLILMNEGSSIAATTGLVNMTTAGVDGGSITLSNVLAGSNSANALLVSANGSILDGTNAVAETANLTTNGTLSLTSLNGSIGASGVADIDINTASLVFNASSLTNGSVFITDLSLGLRITDNSIAMSGGALSALSPLTISANITVGASFTFTAGNDNAAISDHLTINNSAIVRLDSAVSGTLTFNAGDDIFFDSGSVITAGGGSHAVLLNADLDGAIDLVRGSIRQNGAAAIDVTTNQLMASSAAGIDIDTNVDTLNAANSISGDIRVDEQNAIQLDSVVNSGGSVLISAAGLVNAVLVTTSGVGSNVNITTTADDIRIGSITASGDAVIQAFLNIVDGDTGIDNLDVEAQNVTLTANNGSIGSVDPNIFTAVPDPIEVSAIGTYTANAVNGMVALDIADAGSVTLNTNTAWIQSANDINAALLPASILNLTNLALVADVDNNGVGNLNLGAVISIRGDLRLQGADITSTAPLGVINAISTRMMVVSDSSETLFVNAFSDANPLLDAPQLQLDATSGGTLTIEGNFATVPAFKPLSLVDLNGDGVAVQTVGLINQELHIRAAGDLLVNNAVNSQGFATLIAVDDVFINANISAVREVYVLAQNTLIDGAPNDGVIMASATRIRTTGANILVEARNEGDIRLGLLDAGNANVGLLSERSILDNNAPRLLTADANAAQNQVTLTNAVGLQVGDSVSLRDNNSRSEIFTITAIAANTLTLSGNLSSAFETTQSASLSTLNVRATNLTMFADSNLSGTGSIGGSDLLNPIANQNRFAIDTRVAFVASTSAEGTYVLEYDGLSIASIPVNPTFVQQVNFDGTLSPIALSGLTGLNNVLLNAPIKLQSIAGDVSVDAPIFSVGDGDILVQSLAINGDIIVNANIQSDLGNISLIAGDDLRLNANVDVFGAAIDEGTIYFLAENGSPAEVGNNGIIMASASIVSTAGTNVSLIANNDGDVLLARITTGGVNGDVSISAQGSVLDNNDTVPNANNVFARFLRMVADSDAGLGESGSIGQADPLSVDPSANANAIDTQVSTLAAASTSGLYVLEANDVLIDTVAAIGVNIVNFNSTNSGLLTPTLSDLTSGGPIKLVTLDGSIVVNDGFDADGVGVVSTGAGDILLEARRVVAVVSNITTTTAIESNGGHISLIANNNIDVGDDVRTNGTGTTFMDALTGSISIADGPDADFDGIRTVNGDILLRAATDIAINAIITSQADIGIVAGQNTSQSTSIESTAGSVLINAGVDFTMSSVATTVASVNLVVDVGGNLLLSEVRATNVGLRAGGDIVDQNAGTNVFATNLSLRAGGTIGAPAPGFLEGVNPFAIDTAVVNLAAFAVNGIYVQEADDIAIDGIAVIAVNIDEVERVNFRSDRTLILGVSGSLAALSDLTSNGPIKLVTDDGSILVNDGFNANGLGVVSTGAGDILLEARFVAPGVRSDITTTTGIESNGGHISLIADNNVTLGDDVRTNGTGTIFVNAQNGSISISDSADGDDLGVQNVAGDVLLQAFTDISINATIRSQQDIGVVAGRDVLQTATIESTAGDVLVRAGRDYTMSALAITTANTDVVVSSGRNLALAEVQAINVGLQAVGNITDANPGLNVTATNLSMRAGGMIGAPAPGFAETVNPFAIDTQVVTLAAVSGTGIYVQESDDIAIDSVAIITANSIDVERVNFRSSPRTLLVEPSLATGELSDLTSGGPIKLVTNDGSIQVNDGLDGDALGMESTGAGDILLEARFVAPGARSNITTTTGVQSNGGHISLIADNNVTLGDDVRTNGTGSIFVDAQNGSIQVSDSADADLQGIESAAGDIFLRSLVDVFVDARISSQADIGVSAGRDVLQTSSIESTAGSVSIRAGVNYTMSASATTIAFANLVVDVGADLSLSEVRATNVGLRAGNDIIDANAGTNVFATNLSMRAGGLIGAPAPAFPEGVNPFAIDTNVVTMAAEGLNGIYVQEFDDISIDGVAAIAVSIDVQQVNFRSDPRTAVLSPLSVAALSDLTSGGPIKLVTDDGSIAINDGLDSDGLGVVSTGAGDILVEARFVAPGARSNITSTAGIESNSGHISLIADNNVTVGDDVRTNGTGSIFVNAQNGSISVAESIDADEDGIRSAIGDVLLRAFQDISINARMTTQSDIGLVAGRDILQSSSITTSAGDVLIRAGRDYRMSAVAATSASSDLVVFAGGEIALGLVSGINVGLQAFGNISDANILPVDALNVVATNLSMRSGGTIGAPAPASPESVNPFAIDTSVVTLAADALSGIYVQESDSIAIDNVAIIATSTINIEQVNFRSSPRTPISEPSLAVSALSDLTSGGPIKLVTIDGSIVVSDGDADGIGIMSSGSGDILLEARFVAPGTRSNITTTTGVQSNGGHISIIADNDVILGDDVQTNGTASIFVNAQSGSILVADGADADPIGILNLSGDILLTAFNDVTINARIASQLDIGIVAGRDILQSSNILTTNGDVLIRAGRHYTMSDVATTTANTNVVIIAGNELELTFISATNVGLQAGGNILDANALPVDAINVVANNLSMRAGGMIGAQAPGFPESINPFAIDTSVVTLAAESATGIYVQESNDLSVDTVAIIATNAINVQNVNFRSNPPTPITEPSLAVGSLSDLTSGGQLKLVTIDGSILINDGDDSDGLGVVTSGESDILLDARFVAPGVRSNLITTTGVQSSGGHITLIADNNVSLGDDVRTLGNGSIFVNAQNGSIVISDSTDADNDGIRNALGDILLRSFNDISVDALITSQADVGLIAGRDLTQSTAVATSGGDISIRTGRDYIMTASATSSANGNLVAIASGNIALGRVSGINVGLLATGNITDANILPIDGLNVIASTASMRAGGSIGSAAPMLGAIDNPNAIDTQVVTVSALAATGIYLQEVDSIAIDEVPIIATDSINVEQVNFRSTPRTPIVESPLSVGALSDLTSNGPISIVTNDGSIAINDGNDSDSLGVTTSAANDILIVARFIPDGARSNITTTAIVESAGGLIRIIADNSITIGNDVRTTGTGDIILFANGSIDESQAGARVVGQQLTIFAGRSAHLSEVSVDFLSAQVTVNEVLVRQQTNALASFEGRDFLNRLSQTTIAANIAGGSTRVSDTIDGLSVGTNSLREHFDFQQRYEGIGYALFLVNDKSLIVQSVLAGASDNPNLYIETINAGDLNLNGSIASVSNNNVHGGVVLVAGGKLNQNAGNVETMASLGGGMNATHRMLNNGASDLLDTTFFDAGEPGAGVNRSTNFVYSGIGSDDPANNKHRFQQVAIRFGVANESGFIAFIGYADGAVNFFSTTATSGENNLLVPSNPVLPSSPFANPAGLFIRNSEFDSIFLQANLALPTDAALRRADNLFLFQGNKNADYVNPTSAFEDLSYDSKPILGVLGIGGGGIPMPTNPIAPPVPSPSMFIEAKLIPTIDVIQIIPPELDVTLDKDALVQVYRIEYTDKNNDGQPDRDELPSVNEIIQKVGGEGLSKTSVTAKTEDGTVEINIPKVAIPKLTAGAPTPADVEAIKQAILADPTKPTGAYTIIFQDLQGNRSVLDVFPVRDLPEQASVSDEPVIVPLPETESQPVPNPQPKLIDQGASFVPSEQSDEALITENRTHESTNSRTASIGFLLGSMAVLRERRRQKQELSNDGLQSSTIASNENINVGYSQSDRRRRRLHRALREAR